jgi:uncharacterized protein
MDDIGLHLAKKPSASARSLGRMLVAAMPVLLTVLSVVGTAAMLWVGGGIVLHQLELLGIHGPAEIAHSIQHAVEHATGPLAVLLGGASYALASAVLGLAIGTVIAFALHGVAKLRGKDAH